MKAIESTLSTLREASERSDGSDGRILIAYSGGKDSLAVLDLCSRAFRRCVCFFMWTVPDLRCVEEGLAWARDRYGVEVLQYPHWLVPQWLQGGVFCDPRPAWDRLPEWRLRDVYNAVIGDTGIPLIATGAKKRDSAWRKYNLHKTKGQGEIVYPLLEWSKLDVLAYLKAHKIPLPPSSGRAATGIDLSEPSVLWLHDTYPEDFEGLCRLYPYARAIVERRRIYGA